MFIFFNNITFDNKIYETKLSLNICTENLFFTSFNKNLIFFCFFAFLTLSKIRNKIELQQYNSRSR